MKKDLFSMLDGIREELLLEAEPSIYKYYVRTGEGKTQKLRSPRRISGGLVAAALCGIFAIGLYAGILTNGFGFIGKNPPVTETLPPEEETYPETIDPCLLGQHNVETWTTTKEATCYEEGQMTGSCTLCLTAQTKSIEKLPHTFKDGYCEICGINENASEQIVMERIPDKEEAVIVSAKNVRTETLTLPNVYYHPELGFLPVTAIGDEALASLGKVRIIVVPDSVTTIGTRAFRNCAQLETVVLPEAPIAFGEGTFIGCDSLTSVNLFKEQTTLPENMFSGCYSLRTIELPDGLTDLPSGFFRECDGLQEVILPDGLVSIGEYAFYHCTALASLRLPETLVKIDQYAFSGCSDLATFRLPSGLEVIGSFALQDCRSITALDLPGSITLIGGNAFDGCLNLNAITLPGSLKTVSAYMFNGCVNLTTVRLREGITTIDKDAFAGCYKLTSISIPASMSSISSRAFMDCPVLQTLTVDEASTNYVYADGCLINRSRKSVILGGVDAVLPTDGSITAINNYAFAGRDIQSVIIPESVTTIGDEAFKGCLKLKELSLPSGLKQMGDSIFRGCVSLHTIHFAEGLKSLGTDMFAECISLTEITLPEGMDTYYRSSFSGCSSLATVTIPRSMTGLHAILANCTGLREVYIPDSLIMLSSDAFENCRKLEAIRYGGTMAQWQELKNYGKEIDWSPVGTGFTVYCSDGEIVIDDPIPEEGENPCAKGHVNQDGYCTVCGMIEGAVETLTVQKISGDGTKAEIVSGDHRLQGEIILPNVYFDAETGTYLPIISINRDAFRGLTGITKVTIPSSVEWIGERAFYGCQGLSEVQLLGNNKRIAAEAFAHCAALRSIDLSENVVDIQTNAFSYSGLESFTLYPEVLTYYWADLIGLTDCPHLRELRFLECKEGLFMSNKVSFSHLTTLYLPEDIRDIRNGLFSTCRSLTDIYYSGSKSYWETKTQDLSLFAFDDLTDTVTVHCADGSLIYRGDGAIIDTEEGSVDAMLQNPCAKGHTFGVGVCTVCGMTEGAQEIFQMTLTEDKKGAVISAIHAGHRTLEGELILPNVYFDPYVGIVPVVMVADGVFEGQAKLTKVVLPATLTHIGSHAFAWCENLTEINFPETLRSIGEYAFADCASLVSADLPDTVEKIGDFAFTNCDTITRFAFPPLVIYASYGLLNGCDGLTEIILHENMNGLDLSLQYCTSLTAIHIPAKMTGLRVGEFAGCSKLREITVAEDNPQFHSYGNLLIITHQKDVLAGGCEPEFPTDGSITGIHNEAFKGRNIKKVVIPEGVEFVGAESFAGCKELTEIVLPYSLYQISYRAFAECTALESVTFPYRITLHEKAFADCTSLKEVNLCARVYGMQEGLFMGCTNLTIVNYEDTVESFEKKFPKAEGVFKRQDGDTTVTVYCTDGELKY